MSTLKTQQWWRYDEKNLDISFSYIIIAIKISKWTTRYWGAADYENTPIQWLRNYKRDKSQKEEKNNIHVTKGEKKNIYIYKQKSKDEINDFNGLTWIANVSEDALWWCSSWRPTFCAIIHRSLVSSAVRSTKRFTSRLGQTSTCIYNVKLTKIHTQSFQITSQLWDYKRCNTINSQQEKNAHAKMCL